MMCDMCNVQMIVCWRKKKRVLAGLSSSYKGKIIPQADPSSLLARYLGFHHGIVYLGPSEILLTETRSLTMSDMGYWQAVDDRPSICLANRQRRQTMLHLKVDLHPKTRSGYSSADMKTGAQNPLFRREWSTSDAFTTSKRNSKIGYMLLYSRSSPD